MAALLAYGDEAMLSHRCATELWDLRRTSSPVIDVMVPARSWRRPRPGINLHRSSTLLPGDIARHRGFRVTSPARTLLDLAGVVSESALERAVERSEALRLFDLRAVRAVIAANRKRREASILAAVVARQQADVVLTRSDLEDLLLGLCHGYGLPRPAVNAQLGRYEVDFLWPRQRVVVETDGREVHATRAAFERDRARDARLVAAGYRVLRFTYRQVTREPEAVAALIRSVIESGSQPPRSISSIR